MDVERIGFAVLAELCTDNVVATAAIVGGKIIDTAQWRAEDLNSRCYVLPYPAHDRLRHFAAERRGWPDRDAASIAQ
jgi:hypothetical protein